MPYRRPIQFSQGEQVLNQSPAFTDVNLFTSDMPSARGGRA